MSDESIQPDPAAIFACALSLWNACDAAVKADASIDLSDACNGMDELMRVVLRIGEKFERWCCTRVAFDELNDVWPYLLQDHFGAACLSFIHPTALSQFDEPDCLRAAMRLPVAIKVDSILPLPLDLRAANPVAGSAFREFSIQTRRDHLEDGEMFPYSADDEPFDEEFGAPYFVLIGISIDRASEVITTRQTYAEITALATKLAPGIAFPHSPTFSPRRSEAR